MDATKPFATCVECLIDYYGPILGTAKDATGHLYLIMRIFSMSEHEENLHDGRDTA